MRIVIGGASGFLGTALVEEFRARGHEVIRLVRGDDSAADASGWDPSKGMVDQRVIDRADVVVNLSGAPIQRWPRTPHHRRAILSSRVSATGTLARALARSPEPAAFLSASGMSFYGADRGSEILDETASSGQGFLAEVAQQWEAATGPAADAGARVCRMRSSVVLDESGGALKLMAIPFRRHGGAVLGSGDQYFSYISRTDWVRAVTLLAESDVHGPVNMSTADPVSNREFTHALAAACEAKAFLTAPSIVLRAALGGLADELLGSLRLEPAALSRAGFSFAAPDLESTIAEALN